MYVKMPVAGRANRVCFEPSDEYKQGGRRGARTIWGTVEGIGIVYQSVLVVFQWKCRLGSKELSMWRRSVGSTSDIKQCGSRPVEQHFEKEVGWSNNLLNVGCWEALQRCDGYDNFTSPLRMRGEASGIHR